MRPWLFIALASTLLASRLAFAGDAAGEVVLSIDGEPVTLGEYRLFLHKSRALVVSRVYREYGLEDRENYWNTPCGDTTPLRMLKEAALANLTESKMQAIMARDAGLVADISYPAFLRSFAQENARRAASSKSGEVIYGPIQLTEEQYYDYLSSKTTIDLEAALPEETLRMTEQGLHTYYDLHKDESCCISRQISLEILGLRFDQAHASTANKLAVQAKNAAAQDGSLAIGEHSEEASLAISQKKRTVELIGLREIPSLIVAAAMPLKTGDVAEVRPDETTIVLIHCLALKNTYTPFEAAKLRVTKDYREAQYKALIHQKVENARIIKGPAYDLLIPW